MKTIKVVAAIICDDIKEKNKIFQMRLGSVFKMRMSILNTATTEQMGYIIFFFFRLHEIYKSVFFCGSSR